jgi:diguanylate cyclase (GGDEF)-like protein
MCKDLKDLICFPKTLAERQGGTDVLPFPIHRPTTHGEACLVLIHPCSPNLGHRYPLGDNDAVIGRQPGAEVVSADPAVSWIHACIERLPDGSFQVTDLGSTNGTYVDHTRVKTAPLRDGCYLQVGRSMYRFLFSGNVESQYHDEIVRLSATDPLTGLPNRRALDESLAREIAWAGAECRPLTLILVDVDQFKLFNDRFGHLTGDQILRSLAVRIGALMRGPDTLARYGGEEFVAILPGVDSETGFRVAERLRLAICDAPFVIDGRPHRVTISAGVGAMQPGESLSPGDLLGRADDQLYEAKQAGRNRVCREVRIV